MFKKLAILCFGFCAFSSVVELKPLLAGSLLFLNVGGKLSFDEPEASDAFQNSSLVYLKPRLENERWQIFALTAGVINLADFDFKLSEDFSVFAKPSLLFAIAGDSMRVLGQDYDTYEYKAHRFGGEAGLRYSFFGERKFLMLQGMIQSDYNFIYSRPGSALFPMPESFQTYGFAFQLSGSRPPPPTELFEFGVFPLLYVGYAFRTKASEFSSSTQEKIAHSISSSAGVKVALPFHPDFVGVGELQAAWVHKADRFNAIRGTSLRSRGLDLFFKDVKSDRVIGGELGVRYYLDAEKTFAIRPFVFSAVYNQLLLPTETAKKALISGGLKFMGRYGPRIIYDAVYALGYGNRADLGIQHEIRLNVGIRLFGNPPPRQRPKDI